MFWNFVNNSVFDKMAQANRADPDQDLHRFPFHSVLKEITAFFIYLYDLDSWSIANILNGYVHFSYMYVIIKVSLWYNIYGN